MKMQHVRGNLIEEVSVVANDEECSLPALEIKKVIKNELHSNQLQYKKVIQS